MSVVGNVGGACNQTTSLVIAGGDIISPTVDVSATF
jgi:hypothetical protein